ncbi:alpha/beta hydrolase [Micromonospora ureilytica]|uniref:Pimeloyl-ACP methyl ester carboxylesterase n=1 Tax=Micromonospora ureilytica TaxID=709868 RepID=A0ABS0JD63_9ACTN|nr:alpha/beta hydrolase [Micromonospora ureilytica]MBG6064998.1 pimeloyl-ACP methyl ester carboxylesterase [Micromonospora ureilytica]
MARRLLTASSVRTGLNIASWIAPALAGHGAYVTFCKTWKRANLRVTEQEVHASAIRDVVVVRGKRVVTYRWGDGVKPVLLLHGWRSRASRFASFVPQLLAHGYSPLSFDAPGHGHSGGEATTVAEYGRVIDEVQRRFGTFEAIVAHSYGVQCALLAVHNGVRTRRLVAISGVADLGFLVDEFHRRLGVNERVVRRLHRRVQQEVFSAGQGGGQRSPGARAEAAVPMLVIHDGSDTTVGMDHANRLIADYAGPARLLVTDRLGHQRILIAREVVQAVVEFVDETPRPASLALAPEADD